MANMGDLASLDSWRANEIQEISSNSYLRVHPEAFDIPVSYQAQNAFRERNAIHYGMFSGQREETYVANNIQYQDGGQNMFDPGPSRTDIRNAVREESAMRYEMFAGRYENTYVTNKIQYKDDGQNMSDPGPSRIDGNVSQDISIPNACLPWINGTRQVYIEVVEEPLSDGIKFRYEKEGRLSSLILGENSTKYHKTFPAIKIYEYEGAAFVVVCLVSVKPPYYQHPHKIVGESCEGGVYYKQIDCNPGMIYRFTDLRMQCVRRKDIKESLAQREASRVDPFGAGFSHMNEPKSINFSFMRLCFQVFLPDSNGKFYIPLPPVISKPFGNKNVCDLTIMKLSHSSAPVSGDQEMILLCGQVQREDIEVIFYEENEKKETVWFETVDVSPEDIHHNSAISFKTPAYIHPDIQRQVKCFIFLRRPSDSIVGRPREFTLYPSKRDLDAAAIADMRKKAQDLELYNILQTSNFISEWLDASNQYNVPENQHDPSPMATILESISNGENASASYLIQSDLAVNTEWVAVQQNVHGDPFDDQMISLSGNLSNMTIYSITEGIGITSAGLIDDKIEDEQNQFQNEMRKKVESAEDTHPRDFHSNESGNLSGMTIDSLTEINGLISVGLIA